MSAGELVMRCFHARTNAHVLHLKTRSYAAHKALNDFYDEIVPLADSFAETYQGEFGIVENYATKYVAYTDPLQMLNELCGWIQSNRADICDRRDTHLQNIIDEIVALIRQTEYKLRFLK
jgi:hypothetical protein